MPPRAEPILTIGHSPDPDDAFMWWPLGDASRGVAPVVDTEGLRFQPVPLDIEALNQRACAQADLDVTALSIRTYPDARRSYALTACGGSFGDGYGPKVVALPEIIRARGGDGRWVGNEGVRVAIPGVRTSAHLALRLWLGKDVAATPTPFERIIGVVLGGRAEAGVVIHEGQLTYEEAGLGLVVDLGAWWGGATGMPLPLGGNAVKRDLDARLGAGTCARVERVLRRSVRYALSEREAGLDYAMGFARDIERAKADRFIAMYVNDLTIDAGPRGERAIRELLTRGHGAGLCADPGEVDMVRGDL